MRMGASGANAFAGVILFCAILCGCGRSDHVGFVSGQITLGGQPLAAAVVKFTPEAGGTPSAAITDDSGRYTLRCTRDQEGAMIGQHTVTISTYAAANPDAEPPRPLVPEKVPAMYNSQTQLRVSVKSGRNTLDFPLETNGPVIQPGRSRED